MAGQDSAKRRQRKLASYHRRVAERVASGMCPKCGKRPPRVVRRAILTPQYRSTSMGYRADRRAKHMPNNTRINESQSRVQHSSCRNPTCHGAPRARAQ